MFFNAALFSTVLLVPAVLAVPSGIGGSIARSQPQVTDYANFTGAVLAVSNVRTILHGLFCDCHRSHLYLV